MSKLAFKESGYYEGSDDGQQPVNVANDVDSVHSTDNSCLNDVDCTDSYSLFDLEPSSVAASLSKKKNKKKRKLDISETSVDNAIAVDTRDDSNNQASEFEGTIEETVSKSAKKKRKRRKVSTGGSFETNESVDRISPDNNNKVSSFLAKFLSTKREAADVPPAPEVEEANDSFLRQFHADFASISEGGAHSSDEEADQGEDQSSVDSNVKARKLAKSLSKRNDSTTNLYASTVEDDTPKVEAVAGPTTVALQLFNLPYRISVEQVSRQYNYSSVYGIQTNPLRYYIVRAAAENIRVPSRPQVRHRDPGGRLEDQVAQWVSHRTRRAGAQPCRRLWVHTHHCGERRRGGAAGGCGWSHG